MLRVIFYVSWACGDLEVKFEEVCVARWGVHVSFPKLRLKERTTDMTAQLS